MQHVTVIAEAGVNHNGDPEMALQLIDAAAAAGADYVKFQTFRADHIATASAPKAGYQQQTTGNTESQLDMIRKLELSEETHLRLVQRCREKNIRFLSTAFDLPSVELLERIGIDFYKIPSGELTNLPYLRKIAALGKPVLLSTGMATLQEVRDTFDVLVNGGIPKERITILQCTTEYPAPPAETNLLAMRTMQQEFGTAVGFSDHTEGITIAIAAVAMGATVIEKHFTLDRNLPGPDHKASLEPDELKAMIDGIRLVEKAIGDGIKRPGNAEQKNINIARKSLHLTKDLPAGHVLAATDLLPKRPGNGISPMLIDSVIGKKLLRDVAADEQLLPGDFA
jgi:N-acetylneuraminate synthase